MKTFKQFLIEKKDHLINRLKNLSPEQKKEIIEFFKKKPNLEGKINWNNKNLTYDNFKDVMSDTKTSRKKNVKTKGIGGLKESEDYLIFNTTNPDVDGYIPLNYEASKHIASRRIGGTEGKWCTAYQKTSIHWDDYIKKGIVLIYLITSNTKYAIAVYPHNKQYEVYDDEDNRIDFDFDVIDVKSEISSQKSILDKSRHKIKEGFSKWIHDAETQNADYEIKGDMVTWNNGIWESGTWENGIWNGGTWENGIWNKGNWKAGTWKGGTWRSGIWENGTWKNGVWNKGTWKDGTWWNGTWNKGTWQGGTWKGGTWLGGYDKNVRFHEAGDSPDKW